MRPEGSYVRLASGGYMHLCTPRAPRGPLSVAVTGLSGDITPGWPVAFEHSGFTLGRERVTMVDAEWARARPPAPAGRPEDVAGAIAAARARVPLPPPALVPGLALLAAGDVDAAAPALAGRGEGLTPAGDDVLTGYVGARAASGERVRLSERVRARASPIGLAYLRCAEAGELPDAAAAVVTAVLSGDGAAAARRAAVLANGWGASSGACLFWGLHAAWAGRAVGRRAGL